MNRRGALASLVAAATVGALLVSGCAAPTRYTPQVVARGELTLRYDGGYQMWSGGRRVARGLAWNGLPDYVRCVPAAHQQARKAKTAGGAALALSWMGGIFAVGSLGSFVGAVVDPEARFAGENPDGTKTPDGSGRIFTWLGAGLAVAVLGTIFAGIGRANKNAANGHAVDALNFYNDSVGSLGATCEDLSYPPPAGPSDEEAPPLPLPAPAPVAPSPTSAPQQGPSTVDPY